MLVVGFALAASALSIGVNTYKKLNLKKRRPEFLAPERLASALDTPPRTTLAGAETMLAPSGAPPATRWQGPTPLRRLSALATNLPATAVRKDLNPAYANHYIAVASTAMGLSVAGIFLYPPLHLLSLPLLLYTAMPLFQATYRALWHEHRLKAEVLDTLAVVGALAAHYYFLTGLECCIYFTGQKLLQKTKNNSRKKLKHLLGDLPRSVWLLRDGVEEQVPYEALCVGDTIIVHAGETVPVDGQITAGLASLDQHMLTGEAQPTEKGVGEQVFAGTMVLSGRLCIQVDKAGSETVAAHIEDILARTADFNGAQQTRVERLADRAVLPTLGLSAFAFSTLGRLSAVTVLNANYMDTARLTSPLGMVNFLTLAAQRGILIKDGRALEALERVDTVVFDKTGTLTLEQPHVREVYTCHGMHADEVLAYAAAAEARQGHPIARAIVQEAMARGLWVPGLEDAHYEMGYGIKVQSAGHCVRVGSARFMAMEGITIPADIRDLQHTSHAQGQSLVFVALDDRLGGAIALQATLRPEARRIMRQLRQRHLTLYIMSGDHAQPTRRLAQELGIEHVFAETLPAEKARLIALLQQEGKSVCFVGDGINDAVALKQADVSISLRGASTVATDTAQLILMDQSLNQLGELFDVAQQFNSNMNISLAAALVPGLMCVGGVFVLHLGLLSASLLYNCSIVAGIGNAMRPWLRGAWENLHADQEGAPEGISPAH